MSSRFKLPASTRFSRGIRIAATVATALCVGAAAHAFDRASYNLAELNISSGVTFLGAARQDLIGMSAGGGGDINGDGLDDIVIGAPLKSNEGENSGGVHVIYGSAEFDVSRYLVSNLNGTNGYTIAGGAVDSRLGHSVSIIDDVNADGLADVLIGAPGSGQAYVVYGNRTPQGAVLDVESLDGSNGFVINGPVATYSYFGWSVSDAGDVNGDNVSDMIIGAPNETDHAYVIFGSAGAVASAINVVDLNGINGFSISSVGGRDAETGYSVSSAGDVNADGIDDVVIGARNASTDGVRTGAAYVVYGSVVGRPSNFDLSTLNGTNGFVLKGVNEEDGAGYAVSNAGDLNADGVDDLAVSAVLADAGGQYGVGAVYVVYGDVGQSAAEIDLTSLDGVRGFTIDGAGENHHTGNAIARAGDLNGDSIDDLLVGAYFAQPGGRAYVVFGSAERSASRLDLGQMDVADGFVMHGIVGSVSGFAVNTAGDFNADGELDFLVSGYAIGTKNETEAGGVHVLFGGGVWGESTDVVDPDLLASYSFASDAADSSRFGNDLVASNARYETAGEGGVVILDPAAGASLVRRATPALAVLRDVSIVASVQLDENDYSPIVAKYSDTVVSRKVLASYSLEILPAGRVRFSWLRRGAQQIESCITDAWALNARRMNEIVATRDAGTGYARIWINGEANTACAGNAGALQRGKRPLFVGSFENGTGVGRTVMRLDELRIHRRVIGGTDVRSLLRRRQARRLP